MANMVRDIMSVGLFFQLLVCATSLAIYMVAIASNPSPTVNFFIMLIGLFLTISSSSVFCYFSENLTTAMEVIGDAFYDFAWYRLTSKQQTLIKLPIQRAQINFRLTGLGIIECSLGVLLTVRIILSHSVCSAGSDDFELSGVGKGWDGVTLARGRNLLR